MKKLIVLLVTSASLFSFDSEGTEKIRKEIARQANVDECLPRVPRWFHLNAKNCLNAGTKQEDADGIIAFHRFPLALTKRLVQFRSRFNTNNENNEIIFSTPGILKFQDKNGQDIYRAVSFELTKADKKDNETKIVKVVNHRTATTSPVDSNAQRELNHIIQNYNHYEQILKNASRNKKNLNLHSDESYEYAVNEKETIVLIKNNKFKDIQVLALLKSNSNSKIK